MAFGQVVWPDRSKCHPTLFTASAEHIPIIVIEELAAHFYMTLQVQSE